MSRLFRVVPMIAWAAVCCAAVAQQPAAKPAEKPAEKAPDKPAAAPPTGAPTKKDIFAMMQQSGAPAPEHKNLNPLVGDFDVEYKLMMMPGMPPMVAKGTGDGKWMLGDRFVIATSAPTNEEELKIGSISCFGYDKRTKKYFWWGIDNTDTYCVYAEGDYDATKKTFTFIGENLEPSAGGKVKFRNVIVIKDDGSRTMTISFEANEAMKKAAPPGAIGPDGWFKVAEMDAKPRKK